MTYHPLASEAAAGCPRADAPATSGEWDFVQSRRQESKTHSASVRSNELTNTSFFDTTAYTPRSSHDEVSQDQVDANDPSFLDTPPAATREQGGTWRTSQAGSVWPEIPEHLDGFLTLVGDDMLPLPGECYLGLSGMNADRPCPPGYVRDVRTIQVGMEEWEFVTDIKCETYGLFALSSDGEREDGWDSGSDGSTVYTELAAEHIVDEYMSPEPTARSYNEQAYDYGGSAIPVSCRKTQGVHWYWPKDE